MNQLVEARPIPKEINPFGSSSREVATATADTEQQRAIAETQAAMVIAKKFPRDPVSAMDAILRSCTRPTLADSALYSYTRGGAEVTGPSIRLAEALAQSWGNMSFGIRELEQRNGESTVQAFAWDIETNTRQVKEFQVSHVRHTKKGKTVLEDPRDIYELVANQGARRLRACILSVIPGDVVEAAVNQCETTLKTSADTSPEAIKKMVAAFAEFKVTPEQIAKRLQCHLEAIRPAQMVQMKKIYASLRDGMSGTADWFEPLTMPDPTATAKKDDQSLKADADFVNGEAVVAKQTKPKAQPKTDEPEQQVQPEPDPQPEHDPETGEIHVGGEAELPQMFGE